MNASNESRKRLNLREARGAVARRRWWLLLPLFLLGAAGGALAGWLPAQYRSEALILVQQQQVPTQLVTPNVNGSAAIRLQTITQQILSRVRLQRLVDTLGLYAADRGRVSTDALVDRMAGNITTTAVTAPDNPDTLIGFRIAFQATNPALAQRVVSELTSLFIEDDLQSRAQLSAGTTGFLQSQLASARQVLADKEAKLAAYKSQHLGHLPEQEQGNLAILQGLNMQLSAAQDASEQAQQNKAYFESLQSEEATQQAAGGGPTDPDSPQARLQVLQVKLSGLLANHNDAYPDVQTTRDEIARLQKQIQTSAASAASAAAPGAAPAARANPVEMDAASHLKALDLEIADKQRLAATLQQRIQTVQSGLNLTPLVEQELAGLTLDVQEAQKNYQSLLQKDQESQLATNLEQDQQGERFQVADPASLPRQPVTPMPLLLIVAGWLGGLVVGLGLVVLRETTDASVRGEESLQQIGGPPLLAAIPRLPEPAQAARWRRAAEYACVLILTAVAVGAACIHP